MTSRPTCRPAGLEQRLHLLAGRPRVGGGLQHDQLAALGDLGQRPAGAQQRAEVGLAVGGQRRRHADEHRVGAGQRRVVGLGVDLVQHRRQPLGGDVLDVGLPGADGRDLGVVDVDGDDVLARLGEGHRQRQPHVAQSDDSDRHRALTIHRVLAAQAPGLVRAHGAPRRTD